MRDGSRSNARSVLPFPVSRHSDLNHDHVHPPKSTRTARHTAVWPPPTPFLSLTLRLFSSPVLQHIQRDAPGVTQRCTGIKRRKGRGYQGPGARVQAREGRDILRRMPPPQAKVRQDCPLWFLQTPGVRVDMSQWQSDHRSGYKVLIPTVSVTWSTSTGGMV